MKIAVLSPIAWRTPPEGYGPWENVASVLTEGLVKSGHEVTLFATADSKTSATLEAVCPKPYEVDKNIDPKVYECLHIGHLMEMADKFDIIHNHFDFLPLSYSGLINTPMVTTIHGFSSDKILPVYRKYNSTTDYISISDSDRHPELDYLATVYHGISSTAFPLLEKKEEYLLFYGRIHPHKGTHAAIAIARKYGLPLIIAGLIQDQGYFEREVEPYINGETVTYLGNVDQVTGSTLLGSAKALLHPIFFDEPFGLSVAEAMMCGTPVIAFDRGSMPELIEHGKTGFLVESVDGAVDSVKNLSSIDPFYCRSHTMGRFGIDTMITSYLNAYKHILSNR